MYSNGMPSSLDKTSADHFTNLPSPMKTKTSEMQSKLSSKHSLLHHESEGEGPDCINLL